MMRWMTLNNLIDNATVTQAYHKNRHFLFIHTPDGIDDQVLLDHFTQKFHPVKEGYLCDWTPATFHYLSSLDRVKFIDINPMARFHKTMPDYLQQAYGVGYEHHEHRRNDHDRHTESSEHETARNDIRTKRASGTTLDEPNQRDGGHDDGVREHNGLSGENQTKEHVPTPSKRSGSGLTQPTSQNPNHFYFNDEQRRNSTAKGFGPAVRIKENIAALKILATLNASGKTATATQKKGLAKYNGWGGLSTVLDPSNEYTAHLDTKPTWLQEAYHELKTLVDSDTLQKLQLSTDTAFYTPPELIEGIWSVVEKMGFKGGRVSDPCTGIGNFPGHAPKHLVDNSRFILGELEPISADIVKHLYPEAHIKTTGFHHDQTPNNYVDLSLSNIPFSETGVYDKDYAKSNLSLHDYFAIKMLDKTKPGGLVCLVASTGIMDKMSQKAKLMLHERAKFIGAVRLPSGTFQAQSGTHVSADVIFLQPRLPSQKASAQENLDWLQTGEFFCQEAGQSEQVNQYFLNNPDNVLGEMKVTNNHLHGRWGIDIINDELDLKQAFESACDSFIPDKNEHKKLSEAVHRLLELAEPMDADIFIRKPNELYSGSLFVADDGLIMTFHSTLNDDNESLVKPYKTSANKVPSATQITRLKGMIAIRDLVNKVLVTQKISDMDTPQYLKARTQLNTLYDAFTKRFKCLNSQTNKGLINQDTQSGLILALEKYDSEKKTASKADIFSKRVLGKVTQPVITTAEDALAACLNERGYIDLEAIAHQLGDSVDRISHALVTAGHIFQNPLTEKWETADQYLSGNVREKLVQAQYAFNENTRYQINIDALEKVIPVDLPFSDIDVRMGANWIPPQIFEDFLNDTFTSPYPSGSVKVSYLSGVEKWEISKQQQMIYGVKATIEYGTTRKSAYDIVSSVVNGGDITVYDSVKYYQDGVEKNRQVLNEEETLIAQSKLDLLTDKFREYLWQKDEKITRQVLDAYNEKLNAWVAPEYDGSHLQLPGLNTQITLRPVQKNVIWRALVEQRLLLAHGVGVGKTFSQVAIAIEAKRLGLCNKPLQIVPNHILEQFGREAQMLYPDKKILVVDKKEMSKDKRQQFIGKVATGDWDLVIIPFSQFTKISAPANWMKEHLSNMRNEIHLAGLECKNNSSSTAKQMARTLRKLENDLTKMAESIKADPGIPIDQLGIDWIQVDEAHNFKNLAAGSAPTQVKTGISGSLRAADLFSKTRWLHSIRGGETGLIYATGTPISNNIFEANVLMQYLMPSLAKQTGILSPDGFASNFLEPISAFEPSPSGSGYVRKTRYQMVNAPELVKILSQVMDIKTADDAGLTLPEMPIMNVVSIMNDEQIAKKADIAERLKDMKRRSGKPEKGADNMLKLMHEGKLSAMTMQLFDPEAEDNPDSKINLCVNHLIREYTEHERLKGTQLVFCDMGTPGGSFQFNLYQDMKSKLIEQGIHADEIAFVHDAKTDTQRSQLFQKVRDGSIRILIGSTGKMGEGTNVQDRISAIHHLTIPWRPSDITQRDGRGARQGNMMDTCKKYLYMTEGSLDAFYWNTLDRKNKQFHALLKGDSSIRRFDDSVDPTYAEALALVTDDPRVKRMLDLESDIRSLEAQEKGWITAKHHLKNTIKSHEKDQHHLKASIKALEALINEVDQEKAARSALVIDQFDKRLEDLTFSTDEGAHDELKQLKIAHQNNPDAQIWTIDTREYGYENLFKGTKAGALKIIVALRKQGFKDIVMSCSGIKISLKGNEKACLTQTDDLLSTRMQYEYTLLDHPRFSSRHIDNIMNHILYSEKRLERLKTDIDEINTDIDDARSGLNRLSDTFEQSDQLRVLKDEKLALELEIAKSAQNENADNPSETDEVSMTLDASNDILNEKANEIQTSPVYH